MIADLNHYFIAILLTGKETTRAGNHFIFLPTSKPLLIIITLKTIPQMALVSFHVKFSIASAQIPRGARLRRGGYCQGADPGAAGKRVLSLLW